MNAIALGLAMLVHSTGGFPAPESSPATIVPAVYSFDLPSSATAPPPRLQPRLLDETRGARGALRLSRPLWPAGALPPAQAKTPRHSKTERVIAIAAGAFGGFMAGGMIGYRLAQESRDDDGVSGLKGVVIGAPIGAVAGALIGYRLTK